MSFLLRIRWSGGCQRIQLPNKEQTTILQLKKSIETNIKEAKVEYQSLNKNGKTNNESFNNIKDLSFYNIKHGDMIYLTLNKSIKKKRKLDDNNNNINEPPKKKRKLNLL